MKFKEYVENLNKLLEDSPETADFEVVSSKDDEGNVFNPIYYAPSVGHYDEREKEFRIDEEEINAVCVN